MTNEEMLLMALNGAQLPDGMTFQPQNNKQAYLAYACGLLTDTSLLPPPRTREEYLLREYCLNGGGGGSGGDAFEINDASYLFYDSARLADADKYISRIKNCTSMKNMFYKWPTGVELADISSVDTSTVEDMSYLFYFCAATEEEIAECISNFDTSNVKNMDYMFAQCSKLENIDISVLNTSNVTGMNYMFSGCTALESIDFSKIDTSKVAGMGSIFGSCKNLKEITGFSATKAQNITIGFPVGSTITSYYALKRLTFRTDELENDFPVAILSPINIKYCDFRREGLVEMFNTLPDTTAIPGVPTAYKKITITGNPAVLDTISFSKVSQKTYKTYEEFESFVTQYYRGLDCSDVSIYYSGVGGAANSTLKAITPDKFGTNGCSIELKAATITIPEEIKLTDEDRAIATAKGWTLVE